MKRLYLLTSLCILFTGCFSQLQAKEKKLLAKEKKVLDETEWLNDRRQTERLSDYAGKNVVLCMFYTQCSLTCSRSLADLKTMQTVFDKQKIPVEFLLISLDEKRDKPEVLAAYRKSQGFDRKNWHFLSGAKGPVTDLADRLGYRRFRMSNAHILHAYRVVTIQPDGTVAFVGEKDKNYKSLFKPAPLIKKSLIEKTPVKNTTP